MIDVTSPWFQPDTIPTREQMSVVTQDHAGSTTMTKLQSQGVITYGEFLSDVLEPETARSGALSRESDQRAMTVISERWFTTLGTPPLGLEAAYDASMYLVGGASHLQDFDQTDAVTELIAEITAQVLAGTHPGIPAGVDTFSIEFDYTSGYFGSNANRLIEVTHTLLDANTVDRDETTSTPGSVYIDDLGVAAIPLSEAGTADDTTVTYGNGGPSGMPPNGWLSTQLENRITSDSLLGIGGYSEYLATAVVGGTVREPVDDAWWEANAWPITANFFNVNYGVPLALGPAWMLAGSSDGGYPTESHINFQTAAEIWFEMDYTPPRYRILYAVDGIPIPPRRIFQRSDGKTHGAARVGRGNTRQSGSRTLGAIL